MAENLKIAFPDIPFNALTYEAQAVVDPFFGPENTVRGARHLRYRQTSAIATALLEADLGVGNTSTTDYWIIARADLLQTQGVTSALLQRSDDGIGWTTEQTESPFGSATLFGPRLQDYFGTFTTTTAHRYWRLNMSGAANNFVFSKFYTGTLFDFGLCGPTEFTYSREPSDRPDFETDSGAIWNQRLEDSMYVLTASFRGITDAKIAEFRDNIVRHGHRAPVFLITTSDHEILDNHRILHCEIQDVSWIKTFDDYNDITIVFRELLG